MEQNVSIHQNNIGEEEILTDPQITSPTHPLVTESLSQRNELLERSSENIESFNPDIPISTEIETVRTRKSVGKRAKKSSVL